MPDQPSAVRVGWIFSLIRSGSSVTAYAAASPFGAAVADEVFHWPRTGPMYAYPRIQRALVRAFAAAGYALSEEVERTARRLLERLGEESGRVVVKHPHLDFPPEDFDARFPDHAGAWLIRNPLHRVNSILWRGLHESLRPGHDLEHFKAFARRWLSRPERERLVYDELRGDAPLFFRRLYHAWGWEATEDQVREAADYASTRYHASCKELESRDPSLVASEGERLLPADVVDAYLEDPFIADLFRQVGWSVDRADYLPEPEARGHAGAARVHAGRGL
jgi:hypothetical protein